MNDEAYISRKFRNIRNWIIAFSLAIMGGMTGFFISYGRTTSIVEHNEENINMLRREYVPGDFLYVMLKSYDLQDDYILGLLNGDEDEAREKLNEFRQFREDVFNNNFRTRGSVELPPIN